MSPYRSDIGCPTSDAYPARFEIVVAVGHTRLADATLLARGAAEAGAAGIAAAPVYHRPATVAELLDLVDYAAGLDAAAKPCEIFFGRDEVLFAAIGPVPIKYIIYYGEPGLNLGARQYSYI